MKLENTFRLAVACPHPEDGTSLMRGIGPLAAMSKQDRRLELDLAQTHPDGSPAYSWDWLVRCDALFLQRPHAAQDVSAAQTARAFGRPVWLDWDDDLSCVPESNHYRQFHDPQEMKFLMTRLWALADVVSVSTEHLRERLLEAGFAPGTPKPLRDQMDAEKVRVIPNACHWELRQHPRTRRVVWRGGKSHDDDIMQFLPEIGAVARLPQFCKWEWWFMGEMSPYVMSRVKAAIPEANLKLGYKDFVHQFVGALGALAPWLVIVPLGDTMFNRSKSNLAWIEATSAGAQCLAPDWLEWQKPGARLYASKAEFQAKLRAALEAFNATVNGDPGRDYIRNHLMLDAVNEQRWKILRQLCAKEQKPIVV